METPVVTHSSTDQSNRGSSESGPPAGQPSVDACSSGKALSRLAMASPFFLGAALYLSVIFAAFSSLPLVYANLRFGRLIGFVCAVLNAAIILALAGRINAAVFFVISVVLATALSECIRLRVRLEWTAVFSVGTMLLVSTVLLLSYSQRFHINPVHKLDEFVGSVVNEVATNVEKYRATSTISSQDLDKFVVDPEMTKRNILFELPSVITISLLVLVVGNLLLILRLNLQLARDTLGLEPDFFKYWKAPDHMVWPTLVAAFCLIVEVPIVSDVALNVLKILLSVYALQGLAITNSLFDVWGVKGLFRPIGYVLAVAILLPLMISLGFFDLWFNFREKFKA